MKKTGGWAIVAGLGFALMLFSYLKYQRPLGPGVTKAEAASIRVSAGSFQLYLAGMSLLLLGGSALLVRLATRLSRVHAPIAIHFPLLEIRRHKKMFCLIHLGYFGLVILFAECALWAPAVQDRLLAQVHGELANRHGPLGIAAVAYTSKNIALAAAVTLAVNFFLGSLLSITLPSVVLPGLGLLVAVARAAGWGLILAPTSLALSWAMLPHSFTLLLEGEAYILASFFALQIPAGLIRARPIAGAAYVRSLKLNAGGCLVTFLVLAVAATYEVTEVILMMP